MLIGTKRTKTNKDQSGKWVPETRDSDEELHLKEQTQ